MLYSAIFGKNNSHANLKKVENLDVDDGDDDNGQQELEHPRKHGVPEIFVLEVRFKNCNTYGFGLLKNTSYFKYKNQHNPIS